MKLFKALSTAVFLAIASPIVIGTVVPAQPLLDNRGDAQGIICQINRDRESRYLSSVFLHRTLSSVAESLSEQYANGRLTNSYFDKIYNSAIAPLGPGVSSSYKILGNFKNDKDYVTELENSIHDALFGRTLDAIGLHESEGVYTIVLATGLSQKPSFIETCPSGNSQYSPLEKSDGLSGVVNGVDLPQFLCALNRERGRVRANAFVVHDALADEALEQVNQMSKLGHYTVNGPRKVDESIYARRVHINKLYWVAGDSYHSAQSLVDVVMSSYGDKALDSSYSVIGVAQKNGFWSVIFGSLYRSVYAYNPCPLTLEDVDRTS
ncbi:hypothetical protein COEREDRAFT_17957 [Coemansia reversa NRRL 1564]|uniref:SCP domain-containing protein n=1 Tax=Coemansia reversa (strain ATCC 12441 / NRRL 1564) TaxID=763665 RepID=A0A2G5B195_COERN|nr:hypothetical protein COEREDRAFT_17957 [Coemansia reversa NRRL 1564]|eukprot:PIA12780.1 hypothetical protein COEREDRAFT_17957 [Coemansia reversa NRRL 1564]